MYEHQSCTSVLQRTCRNLWSPYHGPSIYWVMLKLIKAKIHYFVSEGKTLIKIQGYSSTTASLTVWKWVGRYLNLSMPFSDQSSYGDKNQVWNRRIIGLPGGAGISPKAASRKEQEMVSRNTCDLSDFWYYQTVTCIALSMNRKWWLGATFGVPANLGPCYISVVFLSFCHCFVSVWECLIIHVADNWSLTLIDAVTLA